MKKLSIFFIGILIIIFSSCTFAMPNPKSWEELSKSAKIKTVAKVVRIKTEAKSSIIFREVTFKSDDGYFTGHCISVNKRLYKKPLIIGGVYINPKKGETVYVTVLENGGRITTYQPLKSDEVKKFKSNPDKIRYSWDRAYIEE